MEKHTDTKVTKFRKLLLAEKDRLISVSKNSLRDDLNISTDDLADETDLAASLIQQNFTFRMRDRERKVLSQIEDALNRIESGLFGLCAECEEPIEPKRLEVRPFTLHCISCKEREEHRSKIYA